MRWREVLLFRSTWEVAKLLLRHPLEAGRVLEAYRLNRLMNFIEAEERSQRRLAQWER